MHSNHYTNVFSPLTPYPLPCKYPSYIITVAMISRSPTTGMPYYTSSSVLLCLCQKNPLDLLKLKQDDF